MAEFTILLEELEIGMYLGLHEFEQAAMQRVLVSARIVADSATRAGAGFFDYDAVAGFIRSHAGARIDTQEELVMRIHGFIMGQGAKRAEVTSKKPDVYPDSKSIGVCYRG